MFAILNFFILTLPLLHIFAHDIDKTLPKKHDQKVYETWDQLLQGYNRFFRPNYTGEATSITVDLVLLSFGKIDEREMTLSVDLFLKQTWKDYRLKHNLLYSLTPQLGQKPPSDFIWIPDTVFDNSVKGIRHMVTVVNEMIDILPNGEVSVASRYRIITFCKMNFATYPLDKQKCQISVKSFAYSNNHIQYKWNNIHDGFYIAKSEIAQFSVIDSMYYANGSMGDDSEIHSSLTAEIVFLRRLSVSIIQIFFPVISIVGISWTSFYFHKNCVSARVGVGVTTLLTLVYIWSYIHEISPKVSYVRALDHYLMVSFTFVFTSLIEYTFVMNIDFRQKKEKQQHKARKLSVTSRRLYIQQQTDVCGQMRDVKEELQEHPINARLLKTKFSAVLETNKENSTEDVDNRGRILSTVYSTEDLLKKQNIVNEINSKDDSNKHKIPSRLDVISRYVFPISFFVYNLWFWCNFLSLRKL